MNRHTLSLVFAAAMGCASAPALSADVALYPTGPGEDSAFLRFVNGTDAALQIRASGTNGVIALPVDKPATTFVPVPSGKALEGSAQGATKTAPIAAKAEPGDFTTVLITGSGANLTSQVLREQPDDFDAARASLAFYPLAPTCKQAGLSLAGKDVAIFKDAASGALQRRQLNPLTIEVQANCDGNKVGQPASLTLRAGGRYTAMLVPTAGEPKLLLLNDLPD